MYASRPLVSIIIPTRNRPAFLQEAIYSVRRQTYDHWEAIVVDDSASGLSPVPLAPCAGDSRIRLLNRAGERHGAPACRNQGVATSRGDYLIFLDDDDCLAPSCLETRVLAIGSRPDLDFMVFPCAVFREVPGDRRVLHNVKTNQGDLDRFLLLDTPWQTAGPIWRRDALEEIGAWNEALPSFQDWDFHVRALVGGLRYEWGGVHPDCFWRQPVSRDATVGTRSQSHEHLRSHLKLFSHTAVVMRDAALLDDHRNNLLAGLFFWLAETWLRSGDRVMALSVWRRCEELTGLQEDMYRKGRLLLESPSHMLLRRALRKLLLRPYPSMFQAGDYSRTSRRCRYDVPERSGNAG